MWLLQICCSIKACLAPSARIAPETFAASSDFLVPAPVYASAAYYAPRTSLCSTERGAFYFSAYSDLYQVTRG